MTDTNQNPQPTSRETTRSGIGLLGVAAFATVVLGVIKLLGLAEIGWLVVFMPLIAGFGLVLLGLLLGLLLIITVLIAKAVSGK